MPQPPDKHARNTASTGTRSGKRQAAYRLGLRAETRAVLLLRLKGWRILARRFRANGGEIDIIAQRGDTIAFVEVKARATRALALGSITPSAQRRIAAAARTWRGNQRGVETATFRFDAVLIVPRRWPEHIANIFQPTQP